MGEKTEKATPKKIRDAKKKGQVARSQDFPSAFTFIASIGLLLTLANFLYQKIGGFMTDTFKLTSQGDLLTVIPQLFREAIWIIFITSIPFLAFIALIGIIINFLTIGPMWATEVFKFDVKKFDIVQNLKSKFKMKTLIEILKSIIKVGVAAYIIYDVMYKSVPTLVQTVSLNIEGAFLVFKAFLMEVLIKVGIFFIVVAILDFAYQKFTFAKEMMMEKFEIKQEYKDTEGDPLIKGKRRQIAQEIAYSSGPAAAVQQARAVVTNPTHLAIAVGYNKDIDLAPYILAMGEGPLAERIIFFAEKYGVPIVQNIPLAHKLWEEGEIYEYISEENYEAMAEVLRWVSQLEGKGPELISFEK